MTTSEYKDISKQTSQDSSTQVLDKLSGVAQRASLDPLAFQLASVKRWMQEDLKRMQSKLDEISASGGDETGNLAEKAARYFLAQPGKRIRPLCVILAARMGGRACDEEVVKTAVSAELVHGATLLHDDVLDEGNERRKMPTARIVYSNSVSILAGDHLLVEALKLVQQTGRPQLLSTILEVISQMVAAEALQLERKGRLDPDREVYLQVVRGKTAGLFRWCMGAGATLAGLSSEQVSALEEVGEAIGFAFQLTDDILDLAGDPMVTGKDVLRDLSEGKITWPMIMAVEEDPDLMSQMARAFETGADGWDRRETLAFVERIVQTSAIGKTRAFAEEQGVRAIRGLARLPDSEERRFLEAVVNGVIHRQK